MEEYDENFTPTEPKELCIRCSEVLAPNEMRFTTCDPCDDASENYHWTDRLHAGKDLCKSQ